VYANEPLTSAAETRAPAPQVLVKSRPAANGEGVEDSVAVRDGAVASEASQGTVGLLNPASAAFDPFDSYPPTRIPRVRVQRLIHNCN
jgi:hypothetical protein